jgi:hypothetical protein
MGRWSVRSCAVQRATPVRQPVLQLRSQVVQTGYSIRSPRLGSHAERYLPVRYTEFSVGTAGQINGTTALGHIDRVGVGTGVYSLGAPRQIEFGLHITF